MTYFSVALRGQSFFKEYFFSCSFVQDVGSRCARVLRRVLAHPLKTRAKTVPFYPFFRIKLGPAPAGLGPQTRDPDTVFYNIL